jgi:hypothetical protein
MSELLLLIKSILYQPMIGMDFTKYEPGIFPSFLIARLSVSGAQTCDFVLVDRPLICWYL